MKFVCSVLFAAFLSSTAICMDSPLAKIRSILSRDNTQQQIEELQLKVALLESRLDMENFRQSQEAQYKELIEKVRQLEITLALSSTNISALEPVEKKIEEEFEWRILNLKKAHQFLVSEKKVSICPLCHKLINYKIEDGIVLNFGNILAHLISSHQAQIHRIDRRFQKINVILKYRNNMPTQIDEENYTAYLCASNNNPTWVICPLCDHEESEWKTRLIKLLDHLRNHHKANILHCDEREMVFVIAT